MHIKPADMSDISALTSLLTELFSQEAEFHPNSDAQRMGLEMILSDRKQGIILAAWEEGRIIGMVSVLFSISTALGGRVGWLEDMIVSAPYRGHNIGSELLRHAIDLAKSSGCLRLTLLTDADNHHAHQFYERQGFARSSMVTFRKQLQGTNR